MADGPLILIDGVCSLCSRIARFVIRHERQPRARFAALQTPTGRRTLKDHGLPVDDLDTMVLVMNGRAYTKSDAALRVASLLRAPWSWLGALWIVPRPIRNWCYDRVASNRYRVWGRNDACALPQGVDRDRFVDASEFSEPDTATA